MVYDNDCKYPLFKARFMKEEEKEKDRISEPELSSSTDSPSKEKGLYVIFFP